MTVKDFDRMADTIEKRIQTLKENYVMKPKIRVIFEQNILFSNYNKNGIKKKILSNRKKK